MTAVRYAELRSLSASAAPLRKRIVIEGTIVAETGLIITRDLFFASKVTGTAAALGAAVRSVGTLDQLREGIMSGDVKLVILDLDSPDVSPADVIAELPAEADIATVAFGPHVHQERLEAARSAGFQTVMPRSKFSAGLVEILRDALRNGDGPA